MGVWEKAVNKNVRGAWFWIQLKFTHIGDSEHVNAPEEACVPRGRLTLQGANAQNGDNSVQS